MIEYERDCKFCGKHFIAHSARAAYCSHSCNRRFFYRVHLDRERESWWRKSDKRNRMIRALKAGKKCTCCGSDKNIEFDHISSVLWRNPYGNAMNPYAYLRQQSKFQFLCRLCNRSKG